MESICKLIVGREIELLDWNDCAEFLNSCISFSIKIRMNGYLWQKEKPYKINIISCLAQVTGNVKEGCLF